MYQSCNAGMIHIALASYNGYKHWNKEKLNERDSNAVLVECSSSNIPQG